MPNTEAKATDTPQKTHQREAKDTVCTINMAMTLQCIFKPLTPEKGHKLPMYIGISELVTKSH